MKTVEYGTENRDVALLLHGGGLSHWSCREAAQLLASHFHVAVPVLDGHAGSGRAFTSIEDSAAHIIEYIDERFGGSVKLIAGLSLGGQILTGMLAQRKDICTHAVIESALILPMKMTHALVGPMMSMSYGLIKRKWFARMQFRSLRLKEELYDEYYRDTCLITKANMTAFLKANSNYSPDESISDTKALVHIVVGQKEQPIMKRSAKKLHRLIPGSTLEIKPGLHHGEFSINHGKEYARWLLEITGV